jgi:hypothetical protein
MIDTDLHAAMRQAIEQCEADEWTVQNDGATASFSAIVVASGLLTDKMYCCSVVGVTQVMPGMSLLGSGSPCAPLPATPDDNLICAKSVVQAMFAEHNAEMFEGHHYDLHWPLSLAVELLEQASEEFSRLSDAKL